MDRRQFLKSSAATLFATSLSASLGYADLLSNTSFENWRPGSPYRSDGPAPLAEISAVVDVIVPADPNIPGDFKGTDYNGDWVLAATLGSLGQMLAAIMLNSYARNVAGKKFINCTEEQQMDALKLWVSERADQSATLKELLSGVLTISMIGTYEDNDSEAELELFESMGWYDPNDPSGTFRLPCEGYPDAKQFPVLLKKGLRND